MKKYSKLKLVFLLVLITTLALTGCGANDSKTEETAETKDVTETPAETSKTAETEEPSDLETEEPESGITNVSGTTVNFYGWGGSQRTNEWIDGFLTDLTKEKYDITVNRVGMDIDEILNLMLNEKQAGKEDGSVDLVWINGENFFTAMENDLLYGPFTQDIPNFKKYVDENSEGIKFDFGEPVNGMEAPYGGAQFVFIYDSAKVENVPTDHKSLLEWCKANPGQFTYAALPDFTASAFVRNIISDMVGYEQFMDMEADEEVVKAAIMPVIDYLNELKPYLWNEGQSYPADTPALTNMYADGEISITMSYNPNDASNLIALGQVPETTRTFLFDKGTIANTHFVAIPHNAANKEAAKALVDCILTPEAQAKKYDPAVWGDLPVLDYNKLNEEEKALFESVPSGDATLPLEELADKRIPEMPAKLVPIIEKIWLENVAN